VFGKLFFCHQRSKVDVLVFSGPSASLKEGREAEDEAGLKACRGEGRSKEKEKERIKKGKKQNKKIENYNMEKVGFGKDQRAECAGRRTK